LERRGGELEYFEEANRRIADMTVSVVQREIEAGFTYLEVATIELNGAPLFTSDQRTQHLARAWRAHQVVFRLLEHLADPSQLCVLYEQNQNLAAAILSAGHERQRTEESV
jgi:hypothetical protein